MNVIYDILTEKELEQFTEKDWKLLESLLDDTLAVHVVKYLDSVPENYHVQTLCETYLGKTARSYTFHLQVVEKDIITLVREVQPETVLMNSPEYIANVKEKFTFLKDNYSQLRAMIPARKRTDWEEFCTNLSKMPFATADFMNKLKVNKSMFCTQREVDRPLPTKYIITVKSKWEMALNAILWDERCKQVGNIEYSLNGRLRFF